MRASRFFFFALYFSTLIRYFNEPNTGRIARIFCCTTYMEILVYAFDAYFGCFTFSFVVHGILIPQHFFAGGLTGLTLFFYDSISDYVSLSVLIVLLNIPIFFVGYREFSVKYMLTSIIGMSIYSLSLKLQRDQIFL